MFVAGTGAHGAERRRSSPQGSDRIIQKEAQKVRSGLRSVNKIKSTNCSVKFAELWPEVRTRETRAPVSYSSMVERSLAPLLYGYPPLLSRSPARDDLKKNDDRLRPSGSLAAVTEHLAGEESAYGAETPTHKSIAWCQGQGSVRTFGD